MCLTDFEKMSRALAEFGLPVVVEDAADSECVVHFYCVDIVDQDKIHCAAIAAKNRYGLDQYTIIPVFYSVEETARLYPERYTDYLLNLTVKVSVCTKCISSDKSCYTEAELQEDVLAA